MQQTLDASLDEADLPAVGEIREGLRQLESGTAGMEACLASIAWPRLAACGWVGTGEGKLQPLEEPEMRLYRILEEVEADPYGTYRSWIQRLGRFERALDHLQNRRGL